MSAEVAYTLEQRGGYYQLLRFVVFVAGGYVAFLAYNWKKMWAMWLFGFIAVLF